MLTTSTSTMLLRSGVARSCGLQPVLRTAAAASPYSTKAASPLSLAQKAASAAAAAGQLSLARPPSSSSSRRSILPCTLRLLAPARSASTAPRPSDAQIDASSAAASASASASISAAQPALDWNTFFRLRKTRRRWQLGFSVAALVAGGTAGAAFVSTGAADHLVAQVPLDPLVTLGLITFACAALGWLSGPSMGSSVFYALNRRWQTQMTVKEGQFFARIKKNRVDPSASSAGNPVPDFYGEKISSVAGYRQWLKDQRAFNKKRITFV